MRVESNFRNIGMSKIVQVSEQARLVAPEYEKRTDCPFIYFQRGEVGYPTPHFIASAYQEAFAKGLTKYPKSGGETYFKEAVAKYLGERFISVSPSDILPVHGGQEGLQLIFSLFGGRKCAGFTPCWSCMFDNIFPYANIEFVPIPLMPKGWQIDFKLVEQVFQTQDIEVFYFNSPHNPTGRVFPAKDIAQLLWLCSKYGVLLVSDEAYNELSYGEQPHHGPLVTDTYPNVVSVYTFSKSLAATGCRVGFVVTRRSDIIDLLTRGNYTQTAGVATPTQYAFAKALGHSDFKPWMQMYRAEMSGRANTLAKNLHPKFNAVAPEGAFYCFLDIIEPRDKNRSAEAIEGNVANRLMSNGIAVVPGSSFGRAGYIRLSFSTLESELIASGARRINDVLFGDTLL